MDGWYYLHTNGTMHWKPQADAIIDIRESDFAVAGWPVETEERESAWRIIVEGLAAGARPAQIAGLAVKFGCDDEDAAIYAERVGCTLELDGDQWCAKAGNFENLQESPAGFGTKAYEALSELALALGYRPSKMWGPTFSGLLALNQAVVA